MPCLPSPRRPSGNALPGERLVDCTKFGQRDDKGRHSNLRRKGGRRNHDDFPKGAPAYNLDTEAVGRGYPGGWQAMLRLKASEKEILVRSAAGTAAFFAAMALTVLVGVGLAGCSSRTHMNEQPIFALADGPRKVTPRDELPETLPINDFKSSFFDFDKASLRPGAKDALIETAKWLNRNSDVRLQIEGFCDERGPEDYNLRLGQRRAEAVLTFLVAHGVDRERMTAISYGRLPGHAKDERTKNRRVSVIAIFQ